MLQLSLLFKLDEFNFFSFICVSIVYVLIAKI